MVTHVGIRPEAGGSGGPAVQHVLQEDAADHDVEQALHALAPQRIIGEGQNQQRQDREGQRKGHGLRDRIARQHPPHHALEPHRDPNREGRKESGCEGQARIVWPVDHRKDRIGHQKHRAGKVKRPRQGGHILKEAQEQADQIDRCAVHR